MEQQLCVQLKLLPPCGSAFTGYRQYSRTCQKPLLEGSVCLLSLKFLFREREKPLSPTWGRRVEIRPHQSPQCPPGQRQQEQHTVGPASSACMKPCSGTGVRSWKGTQLLPGLLGCSSWEPGAVQSCHVRSLMTLRPSCWRGRSHVSEPSCISSQPISECNCMGHPKWQLPRWALPEFMTCKLKRLLYDATFWGNLISDNSTWYSVFCHGNVRRFYVIRRECLNKYFKNKNFKDLLINT